MRGIPPIRRRRGEQVATRREADRAPQRRRLAVRTVDVERGDQHPASVLQEGVDLVPPAAELEEIGVADDHQIPTL